MEAVAKAKYIRSSAQKVRLVIKPLRGMPVGQALDYLNYSPRKAAKEVRKVLESAIANAEHNEGADIDELRIKRVWADEGPTLKRWRARAKGRSTKIEKRSCHIVVMVSDKEESK